MNLQSTRPMMTNVQLGENCPDFVSVSDLVMGIEHTVLATNQVASEIKDQLFGLNPTGLANAELKQGGPFNVYDSLLRTRGELNHLLVQLETIRDRLK